MIVPRAVDVGFVALSADELKVILIAEDEMLAVLPKGHRLTEQETVRNSRRMGGSLALSDITVRMWNKANSKFSIEEIPM